MLRGSGNRRSGLSSQAVALGALIVLALAGLYSAGRQTELEQPSAAVKHQEELDEDHAILQTEEENEGIYRHWNAAHNDEITGANIGQEHPSSAWHHELFSKARPVKKVRTHAKVIKDEGDPDNVVKFFPLRWMQQQDDPAVKTRARQGFARTQKLWNAAANDKVVQLLSPPKWSDDKVNGEIGAYQAAADDENSKLRGVFKSARTQKLFIVPQANVLSGAGQEQVTATGTEDVAAEKKAEEAGAHTLVTKAAKRAARAKEGKMRACGPHGCALVSDAVAASCVEAGHSHASCAQDALLRARLLAGGPLPAQKLFTKADRHATLEKQKAKAGPLHCGPGCKRAQEEARREHDPAEKKEEREEKAEAQRAMAKARRAAEPIKVAGGQEKKEAGATLAQEGVSDFQEQGEASPSEAALSHAMSHMAIAKARRAGPVATKAIRMPAKATALWNAAEESAESKAIKLHTKPVFGVPLKGAYRGYQASKQRSYLPKDYHARGAYAEARQQALWNAATDGGSSAVFHPKPKPSYGVPLKGAYRGYDANSQVSYLPKDYQAPGASYSAARTTELWDAAANDASLESTRQKLGIASSASSGTRSPENGDAPRDYIADFH
jgi:hypothetical protein